MYLNFTTFKVIKALDFLFTYSACCIKPVSNVYEFTVWAYVYKISISCIHEKICSSFLSTLFTTVRSVVLKFDISRSFNSSLIDVQIASAALVSFDYSKRNQV